MLNEKAVLWVPSSLPDDFGRRQYTPPVEIKCMWQDVQEQFIDAEGTTRVSKAKVFVDRSIPLGSFLKYGEIRDTVTRQPVDDVPFSVEDAFEVKAVKDVPLRRASQRLRIAWM